MKYKLYVLVLLAVVGILHGATIVVPASADQPVKINLPTGIPAPTAADLAYGPATVKKNPYSQYTPVKKVKLNDEYTLNITVVEKGRGVENDNIVLVWRNEESQGYKDHYEYLYPGKTYLMGWVTINVEIKYNSDQTVSVTIKTK